MDKSPRDRHSESQPDHDPRIQDFLQWFKSPESSRIGCAGFENEEERKYIPLEKLKERLTRRRVEGLLAALFDIEERSAPDVDVVISHYLRPFAILLLIGKGSMIYQFVNHKSLEDDRLPLLQEPSEFPSSTQCNIWTAFRQEQWIFCALTLEYNMGLHIQPDEILPIHYKEKIAEGGSSITYKIIVDREYDKLVPPDHADSSHQHQNAYVLKTYQTTEAQTYYDTEREAFKRLKDDGMPPLNIIGFYGGFVCQETYNIILEYADLGNLDDYMARTPPPSTTQEKVAFWDNFLAVINGLVSIHGEGEDDPDVFQILLGWHQDVNPFNILVKSRGDGKYDCDFKLADLGLSHFEKHMRFLRNVSTQENFGTSTYGAPEARRYDEKLQKCSLRVKQNVDIWSLSCVFSEVATWVNKGWDQLAEYRNRRIQEMEERTGKREDCFHNGIEILTAVGQSHDDIIASQRANDPITSEVVVQLISDMLLFKEGQRPTALFLYAKSRRIIDDVRAKTHAVPRRSINTQRPPLKDPPNFPPNHERHGSGESASVQRQYADPAIWASERSPSLGDNRRAFDGSSRASPQSRVYSDDHDETYEQSVSNAARLPLLQPASGQHVYSSSCDRGRSSSHDRYNQPQETYPIIPEIKSKEPRQAAYNISTLGDLSGMNHTAKSNQALRERNAQNPSLQALSHSASDANDEGSSWDNARRETSYAGVSKSLAATASGNRETRSTLGRGPATPENRKSGTPLPEMSVEEGISLKRRKHRFPREDLFMELKARDHVFLVDNAESMSTHRNEVKMVLELLWAMVSRHDPDGAELYITTDMKALKPKDDFRMLQELDKRPAKDAPDMRHCFAHIIEKYQNQFGTRNITSKLLHWKATPAKGPRKLSLYVLTDGVWQTKTDLRQVIRTLVDHLIQHKLTNKQIGIQFIRFGNDERGMKRLERLDSGLNLDLDLIDTTPSNGSVWKMLLGPVNDTFDDDSNDEENENENEMHRGHRNNTATHVGKGKSKDLLD